jgi:CBS domain-containing protein
VVLDKRGHLKGILSERDVVSNMAKKGMEACSIAVSHVMTKEVTYVKPHQSLDECLKLMIDRNFRHLPVLEEEQVIGMISIRDVMKAVLDERAFQIDQLEYYITNTY